MNAWLFAAVTNVALIPGAVVLILNAHPWFAAL